MCVGGGDGIKLCDFNGVGREDHIEQVRLAVGGKERLEAMSTQSSFLQVALPRKSFMGFPCPGGLCCSKMKETVRGWVVRGAVLFACWKVSLLQFHGCGRRHKMPGQVNSSVYLLRDSGASRAPGKSAHLPPFKNLHLHTVYREAP